jgi:hypothetical protein
VLFERRRKWGRGNGNIMEGQICQGALYTGMELPQCNPLIFLKYKKIKTKILKTYVDSKEKLISKISETN